MDHGSLVTVKELAAWLRITPPTLHRWRKDGRFPDCIPPLTPRSTLLWRRSVIEDWIAHRDRPEAHEHDHLRCQARRRRSLGPGKLTPTQRPDGARVYLFSYTDSGGTQRRIQVGSSKAVAQARARKLIEDRDLELAGLRSQSDAELPWVELLEAHLASLALRSKPGYVDKARAGISRVLSGIQAESVGDVTLRAIHAYRLKRRETVGAKTVSIEIGMVRSMLSWAASEGRLTVNPLINWKDERIQPVRPRRALSESELARLLVVCRRLDVVSLERHQATATCQGGTKSKRWQAQPRLTPIPRILTILFLVKVGCRWGEMRQLNWGDVFPEPMLVSLHGSTTKNKASRQFPIDPELGDLLDQCKQAFHATNGRMPTQSDPILCSPMGRRWGANSRQLSEWLYGALEAAGILRIDGRGESLTIHSLRHTFATRLLRGGVSVTKVMALGGWKTRSVLEQIYCHVEAADARDDVASVPLPEVTTELDDTSPTTPGLSAG